MTFLFSLALTAALISPVFLLAGWLRQAEPVPVRVRFNNVMNRRF